MREHQTQASILVIDDDVSFASSLQKTLGKAGHKIVLATNGVEGMGLIDTCTFDLIITDFRMGSPSGLEVISYIRRRGISTRILLLTAFGNAELTTRAEELGADACLSKPVKRSEILECVARLLSQRSGGPKQTTSDHGGSCAR